MASRRPLLVRLSWADTTVSATLSCVVLYLFLGAAPVHALDPNKRLTQYMHTFWLKRDGSGQGAYGITQTSDGFLWFISDDMSRFDGVRFTSWDGPPNGGSITKGAPFGQLVNAFGDHAGGLWVFGLRTQPRTAFLVSPSSPPWSMNVALDERDRTAERRDPAWHNS